MQKPIKSEQNGKRPADGEVLPALYTRRDVAALLACCEGTIKRWEKAGLLRAIKINRRVTRYEPKAVQSLIDGARIGN